MKRKRTEERSEAFWWGPMIFDVEQAKRLVEDGRPVYTIEPHRAMAGLPVAVPKKVDLECPVIFASLLNMDEYRLGCVLIDGQHRLAYALANGYALDAVVLSPQESLEISVGVSALGVMDWIRLFAVGGLVGVEWNGITSARD